MLSEAFVSFGIITYLCNAILFIAINRQEEIMFTQINTTRQKVFTGYNTTNKNEVIWRICSDGMMQTLYPLYDFCNHLCVSELFIEGLRFNPL